MHAPLPARSLAAAQSPDSTGPSDFELPPLSHPLGEALAPALVPLLDHVCWVMRSIATADEWSSDALRESVRSFAEGARRAGLPRSVVAFLVLSCVRRHGTALDARDRQLAADGCRAWADELEPRA